MEKQKYQHPLIEMFGAKGLALIALAIVTAAILGCYAYMSAQLSPEAKARIAAARRMSEAARMSPEAMREREINQARAACRSLRSKPISQLTMNDLDVLRRCEDVGK